MAVAPPSRQLPPSRDGPHRQGTAAGVYSPVQKGYESGREEPGSASGAAPLAQPRDRRALRVSRAPDLRHAHIAMSGPPPQVPLGRVELAGRNGPPPAPHTPQKDTAMPTEATRRQFLAGTSAFLATTLVGAAARARPHVPAPATPLPPHIIYRLSGRGRRCSQAAKRHNPICALPPSTRPRVTGPIRAIRRGLWR
jgi:hypothetical protein